MPITPDDDEEQTLRLMQRELGKALRLSLRDVAHEPLPQRMVVLLLRLALAQSIRGMLGGRQRTLLDRITKRRRAV